MVLVARPKVHRRWLVADEGGTAELGCRVEATRRRRPTKPGHDGLPRASTRPALARSLPRSHSVFCLLLRRPQQAQRSAAAPPAPLAAESSPTSCNRHRTSATIVPFRVSTSPLSRLSLGKGTLVVSTTARHGKVSPELELYAANYYRGFLVLLFLRG